MKIKGLDGLRAIAVLVVILYHFSYSYFEGGYIGVDLFFVISGFIITYTTIKNFEKHKTINIFKFWIKRVKRLLPILYLVLSSVLVFSYLFERAAFETLKQNVLAALINSSNWYLILSDSDYFASFVTPYPLNHLWSLSIEEQFYMIFPLVFLLLLKKIPKLKIVTVLGVMAVVSIIIMGITYDIDNVSLAYYNTFARMFELLIGCILGVFYSLNTFSEKINRHRILANFLSIFLLIMFIWFSLFLTDSYKFLYYGGFLLISISCSILILVSTIENTYINRILEIKVLKWIGIRSYGLYLWHYPIIVLFINPVNLGEQKLWYSLILFIMMILLSNYTYKYIENPMRYTPIKYLTSYSKSSIFYILMLFLGFVVMIIPTPSYTKVDTYELTPQARVSMFNNLFDPTNLINDITQSSMEDNLLKEEQQNELYKKNILVIGDSLALDIAPNIESHFENATIDGEVGRQMYKLPEILKKYKGFNNENSIIVILLGTNGTFNHEEIIKTLASFNLATILLVNTNSNDSWEDKTNTEIESVVDALSNTYLVDWHTKCEQHLEYFGRDGIHLTKKGSLELTELIIDTAIDVGT